MQYTPLEDESDIPSKLENGESTTGVIDTASNTHSTIHNSSSNGSSKNVIRSAMSKKSNSSELKEPLTGGGKSHDYLNGDDIGHGNGNGNPQNTNGEDDPFYVFQDDLQRKLSLVEEAISNYLGVVLNTDTAINTHEVKENKKILKRHLKHAESTLKDLQTINKLVEKQREKFANIDTVELNERISFVSQSTTQITRVKQSMNSDDIKKKITSDERAFAIRRMGGADVNGNDGKSDLNKENTAFLVDNTTRAQLLMRQQDETLDDLDDAVVRVSQIADTMHEEINAQNRMLMELDEDLQDAEEKLGLIMGKLGKLLKTQNKYQLCTIITLSVIVVVLFFLVIS